MEFGSPARQSQMRPYKDIERWQSRQMEQPSFASHKVVTIACAHGKLHDFQPDVIASGGTDSANLRRLSVETCPKKEASGTPALNVAL